MNRKKKAMIEALKKSLGIISTAAEKVGIHRDTHYNWMRDDPEYAQEVRNINEYTIDFVESKLFQEVNNGNITGMIFYLKTKAKSRGYIERQEVEHSGSVNISEEFNKAYEEWKKTRGGK